MPIAGKVPMIRPLLCNVRALPKYMNESGPLARFECRH